MPVDIHPPIKQLENEALDNYDKAARPRFQGTEATPIEANVNPETLVSALQTAASGNTDTHTQAKGMLQTLAQGYNSWALCGRTSAR